MVATRKGNFGVRRGDKLAGTRVIPLVVKEEVLKAAEAAAADEPLMCVKPYVLKTAAIVATGSEVKQGLIDDRFTPVMRAKLESFGVETVVKAKPGDEMDDIVAAIHDAVERNVDLVLCTGGMSVDPDDNTPGSIKRAGARIVTYGAPVLPGAMFLLSYYESDGRKIPILGLPGCVMYAATTIFDIVLPRLAAGIEVTRKDIRQLGAGGLCQNCQVCHYPNCGFGK
jgi:molybdopterin biosynthesis enzyme